MATWHVAYDSKGVWIGSSLNIRDAEKWANEFGGHIEQVEAPEETDHQ